MKKYVITFRHNCTVSTRIVKAYTYSDAICCVCGLVLSCEML